MPNLLEIFKKKKEVFGAVGRTKNTVNRYAHALQVVGAKTIGKGNLVFFAENIEPDDINGVKHTRHSCALVHRISKRGGVVAYIILGLISIL